MEPEDRIEFAEEVRAACQRGTDWHVLAKLLFEKVDNAAAPREVANVKAIAVDASGYTIGLLNRYVATYARAKLIADNESLPVEELLAPVFNGVETALKLFDLNAERGLHELRLLHAGKTTLAAVRAKLAEAKDLNASYAGLQGAAIPRRLGDIRKDQRQTLIMKSLQNGWPQLSGGYQKIEFKRADRMLSCDCLYRVDRGAGRCSGVELVDGGAAPVFNYIDGLLPASLLRASFFDAYYMIFWTNDSAAHANRAVGLLGWLGIVSIQVLIVERDGLVRRISPDPDGLPSEDVHDRKSKLEEMLAGEHL